MGRIITRIKPEKVLIHNAVEISFLFDLITFEANAIATGPQIQLPAISRSAIGFFNTQYFWKDNTYVKSSKNTKNNPKDHHRI